MGNMMMMMLCVPAGQGADDQVLRGPNRTGQPHVSDAALMLDVAMRAAYSIQAATFTAASVAAPHAFTSASSAVLRRDSVSIA
jgi:hypothetical protein